MKIAWIGKHFGEEPPLVGEKHQGAGGIFFSGCNLHCVFCQNFQISQENEGKEYSVVELADAMMELQESGAVNIDLVTPTIWWKPIQKALALAKQNGLILPIVWNSNAYERVEILREMEGLVDIYLPDFKYGDDEAAMKYSQARNYSTSAANAIAEMLRQSGRLQLDKLGVAQRGVIVRHLIVPNHTSNSLRAIELLFEIDPRLHISLMRQYYPLYQAHRFPEIDRPVNDSEFEEVFDCLCRFGFTNGWVQEESSAEIFIPDFTQEKPFE